MSATKLEEDTVNIIPGPIWASWLRSENTERKYFSRCVKNQIAGAVSNNACCYS